MSIGREIQSFVKWSVVMMLLNAGLVLIVFGLLARENQCSKYLQDSFFQFGYGLLFIGCLSLVFAAIGSLTTWLTDYKRIRQLRRERAALLLELARLESLRVRVPAHDGQDSGAMADSVLAA